MSKIKELKKPKKNRTNKKNKTIIFIIPIILILVLIIIFVTTGFGAKKMNEQTKIKLETNYGNIIIELSKDMPITTGNFKKLVEQKFYDGVIFHRIIKGFMIQGGDPKGTGMGGPGYTIKDEFTDHNENNRGTISMANAGPNTGGSQFFINLVDNNFLDTKHPVFGKVIEGMEIIEIIASVETDTNDKPLKDVVIERALIL